MIKKDQPTRKQKEGKYSNQQIFVYLYMYRNPTTETPSNLLILASSFLLLLPFQPQFHQHIS